MKTNKIVTLTTQLKHLTNLVRNPTQPYTVKQALHKQIQTIEKEISTLRKSPRYAFN